MRGHVSAADVLFLQGEHNGFHHVVAIVKSEFFGTGSKFWWFYLYNQNLLPIQKLHFMHLQQYDKNDCVYLARIGRHS